LLLSSLLSHPISVVLVEDDALTLERLRAAVASDSRLQVAAAFDRMRPALEWLHRQPCDVLLADIGLPDGSGIDLIRGCAVRHPRCDIMVVSIFGDERNVLDAIEAGASGYIVKDADDLDVVQSILDLRAGGSPMSPMIARHLIARMRARPAAPADGPALTRRETETLELIARGYTYHEIGRSLGISISTVQTHIKGMYGKLAVNSRGEAVYEARALGLLRDDDGERRR
jgi:DNA-binding NarL/FixJ family response regulator